MKLLIVFLVFSIFISCDCVQNVSGNIFDKLTGKPLKNVRVQKINKECCEQKSDSLGYFKVEDISGGFRECPPMKIMIAAEGYYMKVVEIENGKHDSIYLMKKAKWE